jgi:hypothetical protein
LQPPRSIAHFYWRALDESGEVATSGLVPNFRRIDVSCRNIFRGTPNKATYRHFATEHCNISNHAVVEIIASFNIAPQ